VIGFIDESSVQLSPNKRRVVNTKVVTYTEGRERRSKTIFGFMALNGKDAVMVSDRARKEDMNRFVELIRTRNANTPILAVMDNVPTHKATIVKESCERLGIERTFLPPYSPDLNPIEFGWKDAKRELSSIPEFDRMARASRRTVLRLFEERKDGYAGYWIRSFLRTTLPE
jgi:putative transposase